MKRFYAKNAANENITAKKPLYLITTLRQVCEFTSHLRLVKAQFLIIRLLRCRCKLRFEFRDNTLTTRHFRQSFQFVRRCFFPFIFKDLIFKT